MANHFEIAIIGAGPGGLGAATNAAVKGLSHIVFEKGQLANTIHNYQRRKHVMAEPSRLPLRAEIGFHAGSREEILESWAEVVTRKQVNLRKVAVTSVKREGDLFKIEAGGESVTARHVVLAIGVQGTPRLLGVPGEELAHVAYTLDDPAKFVGKHVVVVGAGDAGIENALALSEHNIVSIVNRSNEFARAKDANIALIEHAITNGLIRCYYDSTVSRIEPTQIFLEGPEGEVIVPCDHLIARLGCVLPRKFIEECGVKFPNEDPNTPPLINARYESSVPNLYIVGALIGYPLIKHAINQGYEVVEAICGKPVEPADQGLVEEVLRPLGKVAASNKFSQGSVAEMLAGLRGQLPLFADLTDPQFRELIVESKIHLKNPGEIIFERNDYTDTVFTVLDGEVAVQLEDGRQFEIGPQQCFGEYGLISGRRRNATVLASRQGSQLILLETPRKQMLKLISSVASVKRALDELFLFRVLQASIFPEVATSFLEELVKLARMKNFKKGEILFREGDIGDVLYLIRKGSIKISRRDAMGTDVPQTYIPAGNYVGEMALLTDQPTGRSATATAAVATETILIAKTEFLKILRASPDAKSRISRLAEDRRIQNLIEQQNGHIGRVLDFAFAQGVTDADNVLVIDSDLCIGCDNCEKACAATHHGNTRLDRKGGKSLASIQIPISCRHCENPLCMLDCPPEALTRLPDGEVIIRDSCIGCGNCVRNCPYGVIQLVHDENENDASILNRFISSFKETFLGGQPVLGPAMAAKCDMCSELSGGPACVRSCPTGAAMRLRPEKLVELLARKEVRS